MMDCPCCGQKMADGVPVDGLKELVSGSPTAQAIIDVLATVYPRGLNRNAIADRVYARLPSGGPQNAADVVSVTLNRVRPVLKQHGWTAVSKFGREGNIRLQRIEQ